MNYYVYDTTTGEILSTGFVQAETDADKERVLNGLTKSNAQAMEGECDAKTQKFDLSSNKLVEYTKPEPIIDYEKRNRSLRDTLLRESDWTQFSDSPLSVVKKAEWAAYRQALRDLSEAVPNFATAYIPVGSIPLKPQ